MPESHLPCTEKGDAQVAASTASPVVALVVVLGEVAEELSHGDATLVEKKKGGHVWLDS